MAVAPTGAIYKSLYFDGEDSRDYGVYITGEAVYNAPEREVEMIPIPGRNGAFALDKGRFENIEVTYSAGIFADTETDFVEAVSDFRNFLCSRKGYVRLQDEYNPNEYRMAVYRSGLEVDSEQLRAGEFAITFECKPQRFLTSGETAIDVTSGDEITNPTLFDAAPLLAIEGNGTVNIGDYPITLNSGGVGYVILEQNINIPNQEWRPYAAGLVGATDNVKISGLSNTIQFDYAAPGTPITNITITDSNNLITLTSEINPDGAGGKLFLSFADFTIIKGGSKSGSGQITFVTSGGTAVWSHSYTISLANGDIYLSISASPTPLYSRHIGKWRVKKIDCVSTAQILGTPTYIDCDIGEAYRVDNGKITGINRFINLGSKLPTLMVGNTDITYDNTITDMKVIPRWWKI